LELSVLELLGVVVEEQGHLNRCSFNVRPGEILGLVGPTGAGKSTALRVASGLLTPKRGRLLLKGRDVSRQKKRLLQACALLPEQPEGPFDLKAEAWLRLGLELDGVPKREQRARIEAALGRFPLPKERRLSALSRGELGALALARIWARGPSIFLLDRAGEPLDGEGLRCLTTAIREAAAEGSTLILVESSPHLPSAVCDRVICLEEGAVVREINASAPEFSQEVSKAQGWLR